MIKSKEEKPRKKSLGRGLESLISNSEPLQGERIHEIAIDLIDPNPMQPRYELDEESLEELKQSILEVGVLSPIIVRPNGDRYCLIAGSRRLAASKLAGLKTIPAILRDVDSEELLMLALIENIQREDLNEIELALAYKRLKDEFYLTQHQIAQKVGKSRTVIANTLRLLELSQNIQQAVRNGEITPGHARALLALDEEKRERVLEIIRQKSLSVRDVEEIVKSGEIVEEKPEKEVRVDGVKETKGKEAENDLDPDTRRVLDIIGEYFRTKVEVRNRKKGQGGQVVIHFYGKEDFNYIIQELLGLAGRKKVMETVNKLVELERRLEERE